MDLQARAAVHARAAAYVHVPFEHGRRAGVAEVHRKVHVAARLHALGAHVEGHKLDEALGQQLADHLPNAAKPGDDDVPFQVIHLRVRDLRAGR
eukprot:1193938-Prorocentrum_minimum.AAC.4